MTLKDFVTVNAENGRRVGESHPRSTIPDEIVNEIRRMREERGKSYEQISRKLKIPYCTVKKICRYERRAQIMVKLKRIQKRLEVAPSNKR